MKLLKILLGLLVVYALVVAAFESLLGYFQPQNEQTLVITTFDSAGTAHPRVLVRLESDGKTYVAVNHWPRAWYREALEIPGVQIEMDDVKAAYLAVPVEGAEHLQVDTDNALGLGFRILTGFPPRYFLRLDPV